jgi:hypothetical protein
LVEKEKMNLESIETITRIIKTSNGKNKRYKLLVKPNKEYSL